MIQREIGDRAAVLILEGKVGEGDTIVVDAADGAFDVHAVEGAGRRPDLSGGQSVSGPCAPERRVAASS